MIRKVLLVLCASLCVVTTASYAQTPSLISQSAAADPLQVVSRHASNLIRVNWQAGWNQYRSIRLITAVYEPSCSKHPLEGDEILKVESAVDASLRKAFKDSVNGDGPRLEVRPIITDVRRTNTLLNVVGFAAIQIPISYGAASVRYELFDTESGHRIGIISCERDARPWNVYPWNVLYNFRVLGQSSVILRSDSRTLRKDLLHLGSLKASGAPAPVSGEK